MIWGYHYFWKHPNDGVIQHLGHFLLHLGYGVMMDRLNMIRSNNLSVCIQHLNDGSRMNQVPVMSKIAKKGELVAPCRSSVFLDFRSMNGD